MVEYSLAAESRHTPARPLWHLMACQGLGQGLGAAAKAFAAWESLLYRISFLNRFFTMAGYNFFLEQTFQQVWSDQRSAQMHAKHIFLN